MSKVYQQFNSVTGVAGTAFGGGGGGGGGSRQKRKKQSRAVKLNFSGPARESEDRRTGNSTALMNARAQSEKKPADQKLFSQFNPNVSGGFHDRDRNPSKNTIEVAKKAWNNSSYRDKADLVGTVITTSNPISMGAVALSIAAEAADNQ